MKTEKHVVILWLIISLLLPTLACAQYKFDNVLYGAAYYHEYMPTDRLDKDIQMMKDCGLSVVRVGESSWPCADTSAYKLTITLLHPNRKIRSS